MVLPEKKEKYRNEAYSAQEKNLRELERSMSWAFGSRITVEPCIGTEDDYQNHIDCNIFFQEKNDPPSLLYIADLKTKVGIPFCFTYKNSKGQKYFETTKSTHIIFATNRWFFFVPMTKLSHWILETRPVYYINKEDFSEFIRIEENIVQKLCIMIFPRQN